MPDEWMLLGVSLMAILRRAEASLDIRSDYNKRCLAALVWEYHDDNQAFKEGEVWRESIAQ